MTYKRTRRLGLFLVLLAAGCVVQEPGTSVDVAVLSSAASAPRAEVTSDLGYHIQLDQLYFVLSRVELIPCPGAQRVSVLRELVGLSIAHAHGTNTATAWTIPNVLAPLVDSAPIAFAILHPPALAYCGLRVSLEAADADAERMPTEIDLDGLSMFIAGAYAENGKSPGVNFSYQSLVSSTADLPLVDRRGNPTPVVLSEDNLHVSVQVELAYQQFFDGLALFPGAFSTFGDVVLSQMLNHAKAVVVDDAR